MADESKDAQWQSEPTDVINGKDLSPGRPYFGMPIPSGKVEKPMSGDPAKAKE